VWRGIQLRYGQQKNTGTLALFNSDLNQRQMFGAIRQNNDVLNSIFVAAKHTAFLNFYNSYDPSLTISAIRPFGRKSENKKSLS